LRKETFIAGGYLALPAWPYALCSGGTVRLAGIALRIRQIISDPVFLPALG